MRHISWEIVIAGFLLLIASSIMVCENSNNNKINIEPVTSPSSPPKPPVPNSPNYVTTGKWTSSSPGVFYLKRNLDATSLENFELLLSNGSINFIGSDTDSEASFTLEASGSSLTQDQLEDNLNPIISINQSNAKVLVESDLNSRRRAVQINAIIRLPKNTNISSKTSGGHIMVKNFKGINKHVSGGGHITIEDIIGKVEASTAGGHIQILNSDGDFSAKSAGGNLSASNSSGTCVFNTAGGNIKIINFSGNCEASTSGGNIEAYFQELKGDFISKTSAGSITISIPKNSDAQISLKGSQVELDSNFTLNGSSKIDTKSVEAKIKQGLYHLKAAAGFGKVVLKSNE